MVIGGRRAVSELPGAVVAPRADHVVIGTDYPYDMGYYKPVDFVNRTKSLSRTQKDAIIGGNAAKLLGLKKKA